MLTPLNSSCCWLLLRWGFAPLANAPSGVPAAVDPAAAMPKPAQPKAGPTKRQHCSTTKELLLWGGASLRSPMRLPGCCCRATRTPDQQHCSTTKELLLWGGASLRSPCLEPGQLTRAGTVDFAAAAAALAAARRSPWEGEPPGFRASGLSGLPGFRAFRASGLSGLPGFRASGLSGLPGCSSCCRFRSLPRPLPSAPSGFPVRIRLKLLIITANYLY